MKKLALVAMICAIAACGKKKNDDFMPQQELPQGTVDQMVHYDENGNPDAIGGMVLRMMADGVTLYSDHAIYLQKGKIVPYSEVNSNIGYCSLQTAENSKNLLTLRRDNVLVFKPNLDAGSNDFKVRTQIIDVDSYNFVAKFKVSARAETTVNMVCMKDTTGIQFTTDTEALTQGDYMTISDLYSTLGPLIQLNRVLPSTLEVPKKVQAEAPIEY